jgi:hypothetical protein
MHDALLFRHRLSLHILSVLGAASLAACTGGGSGRSGLTGTTGAGSASGHGGSNAKTATATTASTGGMGGGLLDAGSGGGGGGGSGGSGGATGAVIAQQCFDWPPDGGVAVASDAGEDAAVATLPYDAGPLVEGCPTDAQLVIYEISLSTCPGGTGWDPYMVLTPPMLNASNQCCYTVDLRVCFNGGRPYLVDDSARVAALVRGGGGWAEGAVPGDDGAPKPPALDGLEPEARAALAGAWAEDGLREHASVASFSRFALDLLAMGAPAALVELAQRAALDEIRHSRLCFALASAYAGEALGPGPFPLGAGVRLATCLTELAASTVKEGCVGETVAAVMASEQLARATDPAVRAVLARIAADEARHAELAWRAVAWAMSAGGEEVRAVVAQAFAEAASGLDVGGVAEEERALEAHGRLGWATAVGVAASALAEVVKPCAATLLATRPGPPDPRAPSAAPRAGATLESM